VIGGRVLDSTAVRAIASGESEYAAALLAVATELGITLAVPAAALEEAWRWSVPAERPWLELLAQASPVVVLDLDAAAARTTGLLASDAGQPQSAPATAQSAVVALQRDWPVVTRDPDAVLLLGSTLRTETIP
jgi:predicted nucleic acid-binding protein